MATGKAPLGGVAGPTGESTKLVRSLTARVGVGFAPQAQGTRTGTLVIASNDPASPASVLLSGTGGQLPQGPRGLTGPAGSNGEIELITCKSVTKTVTRKVHGKSKKVKVTVQKCTGKLVSGPVSFTIGGAADKATISRAGVVYARGISVAAGAGRSQLLLTRSRSLRRGWYTLTLTRRLGHRRITHRLRIEIA